MALAHVRRGSGPPLVLIHGIGSQWQMWKPVLERLSREREVVAVDLPGFGDSASLPGPPTIEALAVSVAGVPRGAWAGRRARGGQLTRRRGRPGDGARRDRPLGLRPLPRGLREHARGHLRARGTASPHGTKRKAARPLRRARGRAGPCGARSPSATSSRGRGASPADEARRRAAQPRALAPLSRRRSRRSATTAFGGRTLGLPGHRRLGREGPAADLLAPERASAQAPARRPPRDAGPAAGTSRPGTTPSRSRGCCWRGSAS